MSHKKKMVRELFTYSDVDLLALIAKGDNNAFTELYDRYWDKLLFIAGVKFRNLSMAEEMVQDIFLDIWNRREELKIIGNVEAYLAVSMKYKVINAQARLKRHTDFQKFALQNLPLEDDSTQELLSFQDLRDSLSKFVSKLPERCRLTYQLSKEHGFSQKEIAEHLAISEKAVEANLARALKSLRVSINKLFSSLLYYIL